jgi:CxxC-x17-CxxC domain-containing protein
VYQDRTLTCADCGTQFVFTSSEQQFYADRQFSEPRRCSSCRASRKAARPSGGSNSYGTASYGTREPRTREMFTVTCSSCGRDAQVPFRPTSGKPVYCNDCFASRRA